MVFLKLLENIRDKTTNLVDSQNYDPVQFSVESAKPGFGDITCNVSFLLSKQLKKSPQEISAELSKLYQFNDLPEIKNVQAHPSGYLNFEIDYTKFNNDVISTSVQNDYGTIDIGKSEKIVVVSSNVKISKFSEPNVFSEIPLLPKIPLNGAIISPDFNLAITSPFSTL